MSTDAVLRIALTGGIASGKSACLRRFSALGADTLDADLVARDVVAPGTPGLGAVVTRFGRGVLTPEGALDRQALGQLVFADADARHDLEAIVHPAVYRAVSAWLDELHRAAVTPRATARPRVAVADIPLLFETGHEGAFDRVVVAACRPDQQLVRLMARDGLDETAARARLDAQWPLDDKVARADFVVDTSGSLAGTEAAVDAVWQRLTA